MDLDEKLSEAFASWSGARDELARLRAQLPSAQGGQLAHSPETAHLFADIQAQQAVCEERFAQLVAVAEHRAQSMEGREQDGQRRPAADPPPADPEPGDSPSP